MDIVKIIEKFKNNTSEKNFKFNKPVSDKLIQKVEKIFNVSFSEDLKYFYKSLNGIESDDQFIFRIISLQEVLDNYYQDGDDCFVFAEYLIYGDIWEFDFNSNTEKITSYITDEKDKQIAYRITWTDSFAEFLNLYYHKDLDGLLDREIELSKNEYNRETYIPITNTDKKTKNTNNDNVTFGSERKNFFEKVCDIIKNKWQH